ncbi:hypothetical protein ACFSE0_10855 [Ochrobactrum teleogrylli]|uniref:Uncharacterized protein n=1 Tax=Ochrobactrum teleogrylli TaxID=2479765 RepID=A0ABY2Y848_9HYPH|nr:hypothetical protein [[Ochrobactrum] teleogrylli]TNV17794.1 hypothetical protein FIC94_06355 [[Ochrobactrum] teleogrylli]
MKKYIVFISIAISSFFSTYSYAGNNAALQLNANVETNQPPFLFSKPRTPSKELIFFAGQSESRNRKSMGIIVTYPSQELCVQYVWDFCRGDWDVHRNENGTWSCWCK